jgi:hypothetical protein
MPSRSARVVRGVQQVIVPGHPTMKTCIAVIDEKRVTVRINGTANPAPGEVINVQPTSNPTDANFCEFDTVPTP